MTELFTRVQKIVAENLNVAEDKVVENASFTDDLGADSLGMVELVMKLEEEFGLEISEDEANKLTTVKAAVAYIEENAA